MDENHIPTSMTYPRKGTLNRVLFKAPLIGWRMGLGALLSNPALGGSRTLALTTWGRKSGQPRHTMLSMTAIGDRVYVASGWGSRTDWYRNIENNPAVTVQVGRETFPARAYRVMEAEEFAGVAQSLFASGGNSHFQDWLASMGIEPDITDLLAKQERVYFVGFEPQEVAGPPPLRADLLWVWVLGIAVLVGILLLRLSV